MSELGQWRRRKGISQEAIGKKLGYGDKWPTYAAQERGDNPLPESVAAKLRTMGYDGPMPQEETGTTPNGAYITRDEFLDQMGNLKGRMESFERRMDGLKDAIAAILDRLPSNPRQGTGR